MDNCKEVMEVAEGPSICLDQVKAQPETTPTEQKPSHESKMHIAQSFDHVLSVVRAAIDEIGLTLMMEVDIRRLLHDRLGMVYPKHMIIGFSKPEWVHQALDLDRDLACFMPINLVIYEENEETIICATNPMIRVHNPDIQDLKLEMENALQIVLDKAAQA